MLIKSTNNKDIIIDDEDHDKIIQFKWSFTPNRSPYSSVQAYIDNKWINTLFLNRFVTNTSNSTKVVYKNNNTLDNRKSNLEVLTPQQHSLRVLGKGLKTPVGTSGFRGVFETKKGIFVARIIVKNQRIKIGEFNSAIEAAKAYNKEALKYGKFINPIPQE